MIEVGPRTRKGYGLWQQGDAFRPLRMGQDAIPDLGPDILPGSLFEPSLAPSGDLASYGLGPEALPGSLYNPALAPSAAELESYGLTNPDILRSSIELPPSPTAATTTRDAIRAVETGIKAASDIYKGEVSKDIAAEERRKRQAEAATAAARAKAEEAKARQAEAGAGPLGIPKDVLLVGAGALAVGVVVLLFT